MKKSVYSRPDKPLFLDVKKRNAGAKLLPRITQDLSKPIEVHHSTECHITPKEIVEEKLLAYVSFCASDKLDILEPQAGTGVIASSLENHFHNSNIMAVERDQNLYSTLQNIFSTNTNVRLVNSCFLEASKNLISSFDLIICNPPFRNIKAHIKAALSCLKSGGELIAIVPVTFDDPDASTLEYLGEVFSSTKAKTKIVKFTN